MKKAKIPRIFGYAIDLLSYPDGKPPGFTAVVTSIENRMLEPMPVDERALAILRERGPMTCSYLGEALWAHLSPSGRGRPGTAPYARAAGRVLHRLLRAGRVRKVHGDHHTHWEAR